MCPLNHSVYLAEYTSADNHTLYSMNKDFRALTFNVLIVDILNYLYYVLQRLSFIINYFILTAKYIIFKLFVFNIKLQVNSVLNSCFCRYQ